MEGGGHGGRDALGRLAGGRRAARTGGDTASVGGGGGGARTEAAADGEVPALPLRSESVVCGATQTRRVSESGTLLLASGVSDPLPRDSRPAPRQLAPHDKKAELVRRGQVQAWSWSNSATLVTQCARVALVRLRLCRTRRRASDRRRGRRGCCRSHAATRPRTGQGWSGLCRRRWSSALLDHEKMRVCVFSWSRVARQPLCWSGAGTVAPPLRRPSRSSATALE